MRVVMAPPRKFPRKIFCAMLRGEFQVRRECGAQPLRIEFGLACLDGLRQQIARAQSVEKAFASDRDQRRRPRRRPWPSFVPTIRRRRMVCACGDGSTWL